jgi:hydroxymethylglutaryl-CoA lyase
MNAAVKIVECPRDAWQGLPARIPAETKAAYLRSLIDAGFTHIDAVSFVSPAAVAQMADSEQVLALLDPPPHVEIIGIVVNEKGAERAIRTGRVRTLGFPYSISQEFLRRNQHQTQRESLHQLKIMRDAACANELSVVAYVSMAFGNPYGEPWSTRAILEGCEQLVDLGIRQISLADTVGCATPDEIAATFAAVLSAQPQIELGAHLHARRSEAPSKIRAAFGAGCRRFDAAIGGLGGCPFAQDELVGNIPTEILIASLNDCDAQVPAIGPLDDLIQRSAEIAASAGVFEHRLAPGVKM